MTAVETTSDGKPIRLKLRRVAGFGNASIASFAKSSLDATCEVVSDALHCFTAVTDAGCSHQAIKTPAFKWVNTALGNNKVAITGTYRSLRQKHAPRYLAEFGYRFNRRYDLAAMIPRLTWACLKDNANTIPPPQIG